jgi:CheY-like chemotaxis protein
MVTGSPQARTGVPPGEFSCASGEGKLDRRKGLGIETREAALRDRSAGERQSWLCAGWTSWVTAVKQGRMKERQKRILLVDDETAITELLKITLGDFEVAVVGDAEAALQTAPAFQPDLFIVDLQLPGMRGTLLAELLRKMPEFAETPIFLLSGLIDRPGESKEPVRIDGMAAFAKPFSMAVLRKHAQIHLDGRESSQAALAALQAGHICDH